MDFLNLLGGVNAASPTPNYNATDSITRAGAGSGLFGQTPAQTNAAFDSAYDTGTSKFDPFPTDRTEMDQLQSLYGTVGSAFDVSGTVSKMDQARGTNLLTGQQASNNAAQKFQESQIPGQSNQTGAAMIRAQSLLPFLQSDTAAAQSEGQYQDTAKQGALSAAAGIATTLANLEQNYNQSLASYNSSKASAGLNYANDKTNLGLQASQLNTTSQLSLLNQQAQIAENARQANLSAALNVRNQNINANETATNQQMQAENSILSSKAPSGSWETDNNGNVISGNQNYSAYQAYLASQLQAKSGLSKLAY